LAATLTESIIIVSAWSSLRVDIVGGATTRHRRQLTFRHTPGDRRKPTLQDKIMDRSNGAGLQQLEAIDALHSDFGDADDS